MVTTSSIKLASVDWTRGFGPFGFWPDDDGDTYNGPPKLEPRMVFSSEETAASE